MSSEKVTSVWTFCVLKIYCRRYTATIRFICIVCGALYFIISTNTIRMRLQCVMCILCVICLWPCGSDTCAYVVKDAFCVDESALSCDNFFTIFYENRNEWATLIAHLNDFPGIKLHPNTVQFYWANWDQITLREKRIKPFLSQSLQGHGHCLSAFTFHIGFIFIGQIEFADNYYLFTNFIRLMSWLHSEFHNIYLSLKSIRVFQSFSNESAGHNNVLFCCIVCECRITCTRIKYT